MKYARPIAGIAAVIALAISLNFLVVRETLFTASVLGPLTIAVVCAIVWAALLLIGVARQSGGKTRSLYGLNSVIASLMFLAICITVYAFARHWDTYLDLTWEGRRDFSPITVQVLRNLDEEVKVTCFFLGTGDQLVDMARDNVRRFMDRVEEHTDMIETEFLDPQVDRARLTGLGLDNVSPQGTIVMHRGGRQRALNLSGPNPRLSERNFTNALINIVREDEPTVYFVTGHGGRGIDDRDPQTGYSSLRVLLESEGYQVDTLNLGLTEPEVPADADVLVLMALGSDVTPRVREQLDAYVEEGGRLLVMLDPWRRQQMGLLEREQLRPWIEERFGVRMADGLIFAERQNTQILLTNEAAGFQAEHDEEGDFLGNYNYEHPITRGFTAQMQWPMARAVKPTPRRPDRVTRTPLLRTTPEYWSEQNVELLLQTGQAQRDEDDPQGPLPLAMAATRATDIPVGDTGQTRDARLVAVGASEFASNAFLPVLPGHQNFIMNSIAWLTESEELIAIRPAEGRGQAIILTEAQERFIAWLATLGVLQVCVVAGLITYAVRRKYR